MIICFSGYKGSGKDTCASYLIQNHKAFRVALADPLKDMVSEEYGIDRNSLDNPELKESPILTMPVDPKDGFSRMICEFMKGEFRDQNGKRYGEGSLDSVMYWTPRSLAILKGSTNRSVDSNYWIDRTFKKIEKVLESNSKNIVTVTDLRYKSEMAKFKEKFGENVIFVRVNRAESNSVDPSERDLDDAVFNLYIDNTGSISKLLLQLEKLMEKVSPENWLYGLSEDPDGL